MSKSTDDLRSVAKSAAREGWDRWASVCSDAATRMQRLEGYIVELHREFYPGQVPASRKKD